MKTKKATSTPAIVFDNAAWPELNYKDWGPTKKTMQMCTQMIGKTRLGLSPAQPEWMHTCLYLDARGLTTGAMPYSERVVFMGIDVFEGTLWIKVSDGREASIPIGPKRCVANIWKDFTAALTELDIQIHINEKPQELVDTTPFSENKHDCVFIPEQAQKFYQLLAAISGVFEEFRSQFFGRTGIQFWWGAFDLSVLLFSGRHEIAPDDRGYIMRYDLDAEHMNAGFWPGDDKSPQAGFYAYLYPRPDGCESTPIQPKYAGWVEKMSEWMMPYDAVRTCEDPRQAILDFLDSVYAVANTQGAWDREDYKYIQPPTPLPEEVL